MGVPERNCWTPWRAGVNTYPTELKIIEPDRLQIIWSDGETRHYGFQELRENCPCATCLKTRRGEATAGGDGDGPEKDAERVVAMKPVGNYAYSITYGDGHDTGIYTFELLRELGRPVSPEDAPS